MHLEDNDIASAFHQSHVAQHDSGIRFGRRIEHSFDLLTISVKVAHITDQRLHHQRNP
jgi:hypothetical protein